jgi:hypothetical protein
VAKRPDGWIPLSLREIEPKPKQIHEIDGFYIKGVLSERQLDDLVKIRSGIRIGVDLSPYYRRNHKQTEDELLATRHVMHLHLGGQGSDTLLYLIQFPDDVLFLCVDTHVHVEDWPRGNKLPAWKITQFMRGLRARHEERKAALARAREKLLGRKPKPGGQ